MKAPKDEGGSREEPNRKFWWSMAWLQRPVDWSRKGGKGGRRVLDTGVERQGSEEPKKGIDEIPEIDVERLA